MSTCPVSLVPRLPHLLGSHPSSCVVAWYITDRIRLLGSELIEMTHFDSPREGVSGARVQTPKCLPCSSRHHLMLLNLYDNDWHAHRRFLDTCKQEAYKKPPPSLKDQEGGLGVSPPQIQPNFRSRKQRRAVWVLRCSL